MFQYPQRIVGDFNFTLTSNQTSTYRKFQYPQRIVGDFNSARSACGSARSEFQYPQRIVGDFNRRGEFWLSM